MSEYRCKFCGYAQHFDPADEEKMKKIFPEVKNIKANQCPSCKAEDAF